MYVCMYVCVCVCVWTFHGEARLNDETRQK